MSFKNGVKIHVSAQGRIVTYYFVVQCLLKHLFQGKYHFFTTRGWGSWNLGEHMNFGNQKGGTEEFLVP